ncbi:MAG: hypothetical protein ACLFQ5_03635 [Oceanicaulis sp.]
MKNFSVVFTILAAGSLLSACGGERVEFGDDSSTWANDGECDDPRFEGRGMAATLIAEDLGRDATDCKTLYDAGDIRLREVN